MTLRTYSTLPPTPDAGLLVRYMESLAVIVPVARTNLVTNPSIELATTGYTAVGGSIARSASEQAHGAYSLAVTPTAGTTDGAYYGTVALTSGTTYAVSCKVKGAAGVPYVLTLATTGGVDLVTKTFTGTGRWQWIWLFWTETSTTTRRVYVRKNASLSTAVFYLDGLQVEACGSEGVFVTTYIDGDQVGLVASQVPPAYLWSGAPHVSTSSRSGQTRFGGRIMKFKDFGFLLATIIGMGLAPPQHDALRFAQLDGAQYQNTVKPPRTVSLTGRWVAPDPSGLERGIGQLATLLDRDRVGQRQPLILTTQAEDCGVPIGEPVTIPALYQSGLEGSTVELPTAAAAITFTQYAPVVYGGAGGAALTAQESVASANYILKRSNTGRWTTLGSGTNGAVNAIARGLDGRIYVGGDFTDAGGSGADYIAAYDPNTDLWSVLGSATALNAIVHAIAVGPDGRVYVGGAFTNASGIAAADYIAVWDGSVWAALGTGANANVLALEMSTTGVLYAAGEFTDMGGTGADYIAAWNGSAWSTLGGATAVNNFVLGLAASTNGGVYVVGQFTSAGGVPKTSSIAHWDGSSTWTALDDGASTIVYAVGVGPNGLVYVSGGFTSISGVNANYIAAYNGVVWSPLGAGLNNIATELEVAPRGFVYVAGQFTSAGGVTTPDPAAVWTGASWIALDADLPGVNISAIAPMPDGSIYIGFGSSGTATTAALTTVTNNGTASAYPTLTIRGPTTGTSRIYQIINTTTGKAIYFNYTINAGETAVLTLDPTNVTFISSFQGNILRTILPGSQTTEFFLQPGANSISFFAAASTVTAVLTWQTAYLSLSDALYQVSS